MVFRSNVWYLFLQTKHKITTLEIHSYDIVYQLIFKKYYYLYKMQSSIILSWFIITITGSYTLCVKVWGDLIGKAVFLHELKTSLVYGIISNVY